MSTEEQKRVRKTLPSLEDEDDYETSEGEDQGSEDDSEEGEEEEDEEAVSGLEVTEDEGNGETKESDEEEDDESVEEDVQEEEDGSGWADETSESEEEKEEKPKMKAKTKKVVAPSPKETKTKGHGKAPDLPKNIQWALDRFMDLQVLLEKAKDDKSVLVYEPNPRAHECGTAANGCPKCSNSTAEGQPPQCAAAATAIKLDENGEEDCKVTLEESEIKREIEDLKQEMYPFFEKYPGYTYHFTWGLKGSIRMGARTKTIKADKAWCQSVLQKALMKLAKKGKTIKVEDAATLSAEWADEIWETQRFGKINYLQYTKGKVTAKALPRPR